VQAPQVGLVLAGFYLLSGSLWLPMLLHAAIDAVQGRYTNHHFRQVAATP